VDDIDATFRVKTISLLWIFTGLTFLASLITFVLGRDLAGALTRLSLCIASIANGELEAEVPEIERRDEVGLMAWALLILRDNSREAAELRLDQLTGLPARKLLMDRLNQAAATSERSGNYCALMMVDIDKFKMLNDTHGHDIGDMLLRDVADRLRACVREGDTVARLSGDQFVLIVVNGGLREDEAANHVEAMAARVLTSIAEPFHLSSVTHLASASIGMTLFKGASTDVDTLLKQADLAIYKSKEKGGNASHFFDPYMEATVRERAAMERDLRAAIEEKQFQLYYQPQVEADGTLLGVEALVRWNHPSRKVVAPDMFIPLAEETGLIVALGKWVMESACEQLAAWAVSAETADLTISVNVSAREFQQAGFVDHTLATLECTGFNPRRLELELTESLLVENVDEIIAKMSLLRDVGIRFSLDDFGTGYSSLSYLKRMPLDQMKIDRSFVRDVLTDSNAAAIARTIVALANTLGLNVIAEGVETAEQRDFLASCGCRVYQGYYFSRPLPLHDLEKFMHRPALLPALTRS
jgi:diguanylate cyclase (GGDEF)-like protein